MPFVDELSGTLALAKNCVLTARMPFKKVMAALRLLTGTAPDLDEGGIVPFPACPVEGGQVAPIAFLEDGLLVAVSLSVVSVGARLQPTAESQRAFLFALLGCKDPCPDTQRTCHLACTFGGIMISTDPRTGRALAYVSYR